MTIATVMRLERVALLVMFVTGCSDASHPNEVIGLWVNDSTFASGSMRAVDTIELRAGGSFRENRRLIVEGAIGKFQTAQHAKPFGVTAWSVVRNDDGRHLCFSAIGSSTKQCAKLTIVPETEMTLGDTHYQKVK